MEQAKKLKDVTGEYMTAYVKEKGEEDIKWYLETYDELEKSDLAGIKKFTELRKAFVIKYIPELTPTGKEQTVPMKKQMQGLRDYLKDNKK